MTASAIRLLVDQPLAGARNMAIDEAIMESGRRGLVTLRLYRWEPGCLSFGRNQTAVGRYDGDRAADLGYDVVRRPTGGRSVLHHHELTYSFTAPASWASLRDAYVRINRALADEPRLEPVFATRDKRQVLEERHGLVPVIQRSDQYRARTERIIDESAPFALEPEVSVVEERPGSCEIHVRYTNIECVADAKKV